MFSRGAILQCCARKLGTGDEIIGIYNFWATAMRDGDSLQDMRIDVGDISIADLLSINSKYKIEWVQRGHRLDETQQSSVTIKGLGAGAPVIEIRDGVNSIESLHSDTSLLGIIGKLEGRTFRERVMKESGIACENMYGAGVFWLENGSVIGKSVFNEHILADASFVSLNQETIKNKNTLITHASLIQQNEYEINQRVTSSSFNALAHRVATAESSISQKADSYTVELFQTETNTKLNQTVKKNQVIFELNSTTETAQINAAKINFIGLSTFRTADGPNRLEIENGVSLRIYNNNQALTNLTYCQLHMADGAGGQTSIIPGYVNCTNQSGSVYIDGGVLTVNKNTAGQTKIDGHNVYARQFYELGTPLANIYAYKGDLTQIYDTLQSQVNARALTNHSHSEYAQSSHTHSDYDNRITSITNRFNTFESSTLSGIQATLQDLRNRVAYLETHTVQI